MAIDLKKRKVNIPQANLEDYVVTILGRPKSGKTTLFAEVVEDQFGDPMAGLLCAFEPGFHALRVSAENINEWSDFQDVVDQLEEDREELGIKVVGIDTADIAWKYVCDFIVKRQKLKDGKNYQHIGDIPHGKGWNMAQDEMLNLFNRIKKAGYALWIITHDKEKTFTTRSGEQYDKLTCSLPTTARDVVINMADFIVFIDIQKEKVDDQLVDKRYMYFRADGENIEAGCRFKNVPQKVEYGSKYFLDAFKVAVESEFRNKKELAKIAEEQKTEKERKVKEHLESKKNNMDELIIKIKKLAMKLKRDGINVEKLIEAIGNGGNPDEIKDIGTANSVMEKLKALA